MNKIDHFKVFVLCSGDMTVDMDHLRIKRIHLVGFSYIVIEDSVFYIVSFLSQSAWPEKK
jgi:hypothetical protein